MVASTKYRVGKIFKPYIINSALLELIVEKCKNIFKLIEITDSVNEQKADHLAASSYKLINSEITVIQDSEYC